MFFLVSLQKITQKMHIIEDQNLNGDIKDLMDFFFIEGFIIFLELFIQLSGQSVSTAHIPWTPYKYSWINMSLPVLNGLKKCTVV